MAKTTFGLVLEVFWEVEMRFQFSNNLEESKRDSGGKSRRIQEEEKLSSIQSEEACYVVVVA